MDIKDFISGKWLGRLLDLEIVKTKGKTKGQVYFINPEILRSTGFKGKTNLKKIEPHRLCELIIEDLRIYKVSKIGDVQNRIDKEIDRKKIKRQLDKLIEQGILAKTGQLKGTKYFLTQNV